MIKDESTSECSRSIDTFCSCSWSNSSVFSAHNRRRIRGERTYWDGNKNTNQILRIKKIDQRRKRRLNKIKKIKNKGKKCIFWQLVIQSNWKCLLSLDVSLFPFSEERVRISFSKSLNSSDLVLPIFLLDCFCV